MKQKTLCERMLMKQLLQTWVSHKSFPPNDSPPDDHGGSHNAPPDFEEQKHRNNTHESTSDPDLRCSAKATLARGGAFRATCR